MAVAWGWYAFMALVISGLFALVIWLLLEIFKERKKPTDKNFVINFCSHHSAGRFVGTEESVERARDNRFVCLIDPKDIAVDYEGDISKQPVVVDWNKRLVLSKGFPSKDRNVSFYLPPNPEDFPEEFKETALGKAFMWLTELKNYEKTVIGIIREGSDRKDELLQKIGDGEISKEFIQFQEGLVADYLQKVINPKDIKDKSSSLKLGDSSSGS